MIRRLVRVALALPVVAIGIGAMSSATHAGPAAPLCARAAFSHRAGLVVEHGDGQVIRRCVGFDASSVTALSLLQASGLEVGVASYGGGLGAAVCQIDNEPTTYPPGCFTASGSYWVLFVSRGGGAWAASTLGASSVMVASGDDIGFRYGSQTGADPAPPTPAGTCPAVPPPPAPTPTPKATAAVRARTPSSSLATTPTLRPAPPAPATVTPASGVLGVVTPAATPTARSLGSLGPAGDGPGLNAGLLVAAIGAGGLIGLLGARSLRRRRA
jgi:hypothetical protein